MSFIIEENDLRTRNTPNSFYCQADNLAQATSSHAKHSNMKKK